ncbi:MAG: rRNA maturation RNase YbeY [Deltaproteobacteria bacterium]|nr:rRNA maturation RNase YbeY [Deltaproteobacteria bacterium]
MVKKTALATLGGLGLRDKELSLCLIDDEGIRALNKKYRGKDKSTDVLSFCMADEVLLGDVVISIERARAQAEEAGCGLDEEMARLVIHGVLHLVGFDHVKGGHQARKMKIKEAELYGLLRKSWLISG